MQGWIYKMVKKIWELTDTLKCVINGRDILKQRVAINPVDLTFITPCTLQTAEIYSKQA
jgi:hypothetical protein